LFTGMTDFVCEDDGFVRDADSFFMRMDVIYTPPFPEFPPHRHSRENGNLGLSHTLKVTLTNLRI